MSTPNEVPEFGKAIVKYGAEHGQEVGLPSPQAINYMMSVAKLITSTALVGQGMGLSKMQKEEMAKAGFTAMQVYEKDQEVIQANTFAKMLVAQEMKPPIPPLLAQNDIDIVKGKVFVRYQQVIAMIEAKGYKIKQIERSATRAAIEITRGDEPPREFEFTIEDAKTAQLIKRGYNNEPSQYELRPRVMLWSRLMSETNRAIGNNGVYTAEEREEFDREDQPERGDNSNGAFRAEAERQAEAFIVTKVEKAEDAATQNAPTSEPKQEVKPEPISTMDTKAEPPKETRKKEKATPAPTPQPTPPPPLPAQGTFKADDDTLPEIMQPQGAIQGQKGEAAKPPQKQRFEALVAAGIPVATFKAYIQAFAQIPTWEKVPQDKYEIPLSFLEASIPAHKREILEEPSARGLTAGNGWNKLVRHIDGYEYQFKAVCKQTALKEFPDDPELLIELLDQVQADGDVPESDLIVFLLVYQTSTKAAMSFKAKADALGVTMEALAADLPANPTEKDILTLIAGGK